MSNKSISCCDQVTLKNITFPELNSTEFANTLQETFSNINDNFAAIANHDFIKGEDGNSVVIENVDVTSDDVIAIALRSYISELLGEETPLISVNDIQLNYWDNFTGNIQVLYNIDSFTGERIPVSSLQYIFLDGRFWNDKIGNIDPNQFAGIDDLSCIIVYDGKSFKNLGNSLPTIYYENGVGLCWNLNGKRTSIPIQGLPGKDGSNALLRVVKVNSFEENDDDEIMLNTGEVIEIFQSFYGYVDVSKLNIEDFNNNAALIFSNVSGEAYIGTVSIMNGKLYAFCDPNSSISNAIDTNTVYNILKNISIVSKDTEVGNLKGLFIPMTVPTENQPQPVHLIAASSITNSNDNESIDTRNDLLFTPIADINSLENEVVTTGGFKVDKYLYLRVNKDSNIFRGNEDIEEILEKCDYYIKYKLVDAVKANEIDLSSDNFGKVRINQDDQFLTELSSSNCMYVKHLENGGVSFTDKHYETIPAQGKLYHWEIDIDVDKNIDIIELSKLNNQLYSFPKQFTNIYTTTFTPSINTSIYWFNGCDVYRDENDNATCNMYNSTYYTVKGWFDEDGIFEFVKFVPIYNDTEYHINEDTAINFNYNVNISGCKDNNYKKTLTVGGDINCDSAHIDNMISFREAHKIYTKNDIVGDAGLKLGKRQSDSDEIDYNLTIDKNGNVDTNGNVSANILSANELDIDKIGVKNLSVSSDLKLVLDEDVLMTVNSNKLNDASRLKTNISSVGTIDIKKKKILPDFHEIDKRTEEYHLNDIQFENVPKISTDAPIVVHKNADIVVTDLNNLSDIFIDENISKELWLSQGDDYDNIDIPTNNESILRYAVSPNSFETNKTFFEDYINKMHKTLPIHSSDNVISSVVSSFNDPYYQNRVAKCKSATFDSFDASFNINAYDTSKCACLFEINKNISREAYSNELNIAGGINLHFSEFSFNMGIYTHCDNGSWTTMTSNSYMTMHVKIFSKNKYGVMNSIKEIDDTNIYRFYNNQGKAWGGGYNQWGTAVDGKEYEAWRFKSFTVKPYSINISDTETLNTIKNYYDKGDSIVIKVYPHFVISLTHGDKVRKVVEEVAIRKFVPRGSFSEPSTSLLEQKFVTTNEKIDNFSKLTYNTISSVRTGIENMNTTVLCKDGIISLSSKNINTNDGAVNKSYSYGIGMHDGEPTLCYGEIDESKGGRFTYKHKLIKSLFNTTTGDTSVDSGDGTGNSLSDTIANLTLAGLAQRIVELENKVAALQQLHNTESD